MSEGEEKCGGGWVRGENGALRREVLPSKLRRMRDWDYKRPGTYAVTLVLTDRSRDWLGRLVDGRAIELSPLGRAVERCWRELAANWPGVEPRECQVMPDHFHGILRVAVAQRHPLGQILGSFKAKATAAARALGTGTAERGSTAEWGTAERGTAERGTAEQARPHGGAPHGGGPHGGAPHGGAPHGGAPHGGAPHEKTPVVPASLLAGQGLFSPGFQDTILWDLKRYRNERDYLADNPRRLAVKRAHPDLFRVVRDLVVEMPAGRGHFFAIGNHFLLQRPLVQVQVSRRDFAYARDAQGRLLKDAPPAVQTTAFAERKAGLFAAAKHGAVLISPCVSDGEREIARLALSAQLPLVTLHNKGFSPLQKPGGRYFDACADGRLLMLAPAAWPYQPGEKVMTRLDATAMNRLCQYLAQEGAAEINYHGMTPANIDALACAAAKMETTP